MPSKLPFARVIRGDVTVPPPLRVVPSGLRRALIHGEAWIPTFPILAFFLAVTLSGLSQPWWIWLILSGVAFVLMRETYKQLASGARLVSLLEHGIVTRGLEVARTHEPADSDSREHWTVTFEYTANDGVKRTHEVTTPYDATVIGGDMQLVYHPADPAHAVLPAELPSRPLIIDGVIQCGDLYWLRYLFLPAACVVMVVVALVHR